MLNLFIKLCFSLKSAIKLPVMLTTHLKWFTSWERFYAYKSAVSKNCSIIESLTGISYMYQCMYHSISRDHTLHVMLLWAERPILQFLGKINIFLAVHLDYS